MNKMQIFENEEFGSIRTVEVDGIPYFVGKDVAEVLGHGNHRQAIKSNVDDEDKVVHSMDTLGGKQKITLINESGLYSLIVSSRRPEAKAFKRWVTSEVLPSIRQTGGYHADTDYIIQETAKAVAAEMVKQFSPFLHKDSERECGVKTMRASGYKIPPEKMKMETFPLSILHEVDYMLGRMKEVNEFNFSEVARYCIMNGFSISYPAVKRYYTKKFED